MTIQDQAAAFLSQNRIAVVGVSRKKGTGNAIFKALRQRGLDVVPVNPHASEIGGQTCYPSVSAVEGGVDAAVIVTGADNSEKVVRDCVEAGVGHVWMHHNALFGAKGSSVSASAVAYGRDHGLEVVAGGCPLMFGAGADVGHRCMRWLLQVTGKLR